MVLKNRIKESRREELKSRAHMARLSSMADKTFKKAEDGDSSISELTMEKIVNGFNTLPNKKRNYTLDYLFPNRKK